MPPGEDEFTNTALRAKLVSKEQVEECLAEYLRELERDQTRKIEDTFMEKGYLDEDQIHTIKQKIAREIGGYKILSKIAVGGMGTVYKALQKSLGKEVAFKILTPRLARDEEFVKRFAREARSLARLNHPNIVRAIDFGRDKGFTFLSMEFVPGDHLGYKVRTEGPMSEDEVLDVAIQVARGLQSAFEHGIVHRDIKPENIILTPEGVVKITDFGLARKEVGLTDAKEVFRTTVGRVIGTPTYMSPEQITGKEVDIRSDLYALGITLFFLLTGEAPFTGNNEVEVMAAHLGTQIPDPRTRVEQISPWTSKVILRLLQKDPDHRYQTPRELLTDLEPTLPIVEFEGQASPRSSTRAIVRRGRSRSRSGGPSSALVLVGIMTVVLVIGFFFYLMKGGPGSSGIDDRENGTSRGEQGAPGDRRGKDRHRVKNDPGPTKEGHGGTKDGSGGNGKEDPENGKPDHGTDKPDPEKVVENLPDKVVSWMQKARDDARGRDYQQILDRASESFPNPQETPEQVLASLEHVTAASRFLEMAASAFSTVDPGEGLEIWIDLNNSKSSGFLVAREGGTLEVDIDGQRRQVGVAQLSAQFLEGIVTSRLNDRESFKGAGIFFALDGYPDKAKRYLVLAGFGGEEIGRLLSLWGTEEWPRSLLSAGDRKAMELWDRARALARTGDEASARNTITDLLDRYPGSKLVLERREVIQTFEEDLIFSMVSLEGFLGPGWTSQGGVYSVRHDARTDQFLEDWHLEPGRRLPGEDGARFEDAFLSCWKGVWTDFTWTTRLHLKEDAGQFRLRFRHSSRGYFGVSVNLDGAGKGKGSLLLDQHLMRQGKPVRELLEEASLEGVLSAEDSGSVTVVIHCQGPRISIDLNDVKEIIDVENGSHASGTLLIENTGVVGIGEVSISGRFDPRWERETRQVLSIRDDAVTRNQLTFKGSGLHVKGYLGTRPSGTVRATWVDRFLVHSWSRNDPPFPGIKGRSFSLRWRGWVVAPESGDYILGVVFKDGFSLSLSGKELVEDFGDRDSACRWSTSVHLEQGVHQIEIVSLHAGGEGVLQFGWNRPGMPEGTFEPIDGRYLFHTLQDLND